MTSDRPPPSPPETPAGNDVVCGDHWHGLSGEPVDGSTGCPWCHVAELQAEVARLERARDDDGRALAEVCRERDSLPPRDARARGERDGDVPRPDRASPARLAVRRSEARLPRVLLYGPRHQGAVMTTETVCAECGHTRDAHRLRQGDTRPCTGTYGGGCDCPGFALVRPDMAKMIASLPAVSRSSSGSGEREAIHAIRDVWLSARTNDDTPPGCYLVDSEPMLHAHGVMLRALSSAPPSPDSGERVRALEEALRGLLDRVAVCEIAITGASGARDFNNLKDAVDAAERALSPQGTER